jgi:hypothetical protein
LAIIRANGTPMQLYTCSFCPVCDLLADLVVVKNPKSQGLLLYCHHCGCAWPTPPARHQVDQLEPPETYAPDGYKSRARRAVTDYIGHRTDPQWKPSSRARLARNNLGKAGNIRSVEHPLEATMSVSPSVSADLNTGPTKLKHYLPLRPNLAVEILLPWDFTPEEAERVTGWVKALGAFATAKG